MLLNTTSIGTTGRIPSSLLELYVRYKQDTRAIIAWLMRHGAPKCQRLETISVGELLSLSEAVQRKAVAMPDTIDFQFRQAIAARTQLSNFFRREACSGSVDQDTVNHEYFTTR